MCSLPMPAQLIRRVSSVPILMLFQPERNDLVERPGPERCMQRGCRSFRWSGGRSAENLAASAARIGGLAYATGVQNASKSCMALESRHGIRSRWRLLPRAPAPSIWAKIWFATTSPAWLSAGTRAAARLPSKP